MAPLIATNAAVWKALMARKASVRCAAGMTAANGTVSLSLQTGRRDDGMSVTLLHVAVVRPRWQTDDGAAGPRPAAPCVRPSTATG